MKNNFLPVFLGLVVFSLAGCARHYNITLTNNNVISTTGKPKYSKTNDTYYFKDARGKPASVPGFRIKEIGPQ